MLKNRNDRTPRGRIQGKGRRNLPVVVKVCLGCGARVANNQRLVDHMRGSPGCFNTYVEENRIFAAGPGSNRLVVPDTVHVIRDLNGRQKNLYYAVLALAVNGDGHGDLVLYRGYDRADCGHFIARHFGKLVVSTECGASGD